MEPVTHILTGACLARTGLNRKAAYATLAMAVAAEFPDIDTLWGLRGPVVAFQHHRGITHTFLGVPFEAALIVGGIWGLHRWREARVRHALQKAPDPGHAASSRPLTAAPVRWGLLYGFVLLALLSHLWLDFTNNYGIRPFFPFNPRWYAASITFIFDPAMFLLLLAAVVLPPLFRLVSSEVGARRQPFAARGWAWAALLGVCTLWMCRALLHGRATQIAALESYAKVSALPASVQQPSDSAPLEAPSIRILQAQRISMNPDPINPFRWYSVIDFGPLYQLGTLDLRAGTYTPQQETYSKPAPSPELETAEKTLLGRCYMDWSPMPVLEVLRHQGTALEEGPSDATVVTFRDPRFLGDVPWLRRGDRAPLTGVVKMDAEDHVFRQTMDGKVQR